MLALPCPVTCSPRLTQRVAALAQPAPLLHAAVPIAPHPPRLATPLRLLKPLRLLRPRAGRLRIERASFGKLAAGVCRCFHPRSVGVTVSATAAASLWSSRLSCIARPARGRVSPWFARWPLLGRLVSAALRRSQPLSRRCAFLDHPGTLCTGGGRCLLRGESGQSPALPFRGQVVSSRLPRPSRVCSVLRRLGRRGNASKRYLLTGDGCIGRRPGAAGFLPQVLPTERGYLSGSPHSFCIGAV